MKLFNRSSNAEKKWHKKALFVDLSKTRVVFVDTTETRPELEPSRIPKVEPQFVIEELLNQEEYGLLGFFSCPEHSPDSWKREGLGLDVCSGNARSRDRSNAFSLLEKELLITPRMVQFASDATMTLLARYRLPYL